MRKVTTHPPPLNQGGKHFTNHFPVMNIEQITRSMNALESQIAIQQAYIAKHGASNDADSDSQWESYKSAAASNLAQWDKMKAIRDSMKAHG